MLNFKKTNSSDPLKEYELHQRTLPVGIYWPTSEVYEFSISDIKTARGIDIEAEAIHTLVDELIEAWPPYGMNRDMTGLELSIALGEAIHTQRINDE